VGLNEAKCWPTYPCLATKNFKCIYDSDGTSGTCQCDPETPFAWSEETRSCSLCKNGYVIDEVSNTCGTNKKYFLSNFFTRDVTLSLFNFEKKFYFV
jgi:hypothetical protein